MDVDLQGVLLDLCSNTATDFACQTRLTIPQHQASIVFHVSGSVACVQAPLLTQESGSPNRVPSYGIVRVIEFMALDL